MRIKLMLDLEPPAQNRYPEAEEKKSPEERVREAIELVESGHDSLTEWKFLNRTARMLRGRKDTRSKNLLEKIEPVLMKYGMMGDHAGNDEA